MRTNHRSYIILIQRESYFPFNGNCVCTEIAVRVWNAVLCVLGHWAMVLFLKTFLSCAFKRFHCLLVLLSFWTPAGWACCFVALWKRCRLHRGLGSVPFLQGIYRTTFCLLMKTIILSFFLVVAWWRNFHSFYNYWQKCPLFDMFTPFTILVIGAQCFPQDFVGLWWVNLDPSRGVQGSYNCNNILMHFETSKLRVPMFKLNTTLCHSRKIFWLKVQLSFYFGEKL